MSGGHVAVEMLSPPFEPYRAEFFETDDGDIVSHDPHLNSDCNLMSVFFSQHLILSALRQEKYSTYFFLEQSTNYHIGGTHRETRTRLVTKQINGRTETYTVTIKDFFFYIDLSSNTVIGPVYWYRRRKGVVKRQKRKLPHLRSVKIYSAERGLSPWVDPDGPDPLSVLQSSQTLRQWADEYCSSNKLLQEFGYEKFIHEWNIQALEAAIQAAAQETLYSGTVTVQFTLNTMKIWYSTR